MISKERTLSLGSYRIALSNLSSGLALTFLWLGANPIANLNRKAIFIVFSSILFIQFASAQNSLADSPRFEHISTEDGLPAGTVHNIIQDSQGFLWFGTELGGVAKYDGYSFKVFHK